MLGTLLGSQIPANCLASGSTGIAPWSISLLRGSQVKGKWHLKLSEPNGDASMKCGHDVPDKVMTSVDNNVRNLCEIRFCAFHRPHRLGSWF
jgi:hypothetical protein